MSRRLKKTSDVEEEIGGVVSKVVNLKVSHLTSMKGKSFKSLNKRLLNIQSKRFFTLNKMMWFSPK
jgi:hypothetical protein